MARASSPSGGKTTACGGAHPLCKPTDSAASAALWHHTPAPLNTTPDRLRRRDLLGELIHEYEAA
jgi:hypothetical protein